MSQRNDESPVLKIYSGASCHIKDRSLLIRDARPPAKNRSLESNECNRPDLCVPPTDSSKKPRHDPGVVNVTLCKHHYREYK